MTDINCEHTEVLQVQNEKSEALQTLIYGPTGKQKLLYNKSDIAYNLVKDAKQSIYGFTAGNENASKLSKEIQTADTNAENDNHQITLKQDYSAYGQAERTMLEETPQFNGEMLSSGNLTYMRSRSYDPSIGQFTSKDTWLGRQTNPLSQNRNTFVENNPINAIDPSGHWPDWGGMAKAVGDGWNSTVKAAGDTWNSGVKAVGDAWNSGVKAVGDAWNSTTKAIGDGWNNLVEGAKNTWNGVKEWGKNTWNGAKEWGKNTWNGVQNWHQNNVAAQQRAEQARTKT